MRKLIILLLCIVLASCKSARTVERVVEVPIEVIKTEYINKIQYDSIYIRDSIDRYIKNDTVYFTKVQDQVRYKLKQDTIVKHDTIPKIITVTEKTEKVVEVNKLSSWQQAFIKMGELMLGILLGALMYVIYKIYKKLK